MTFTRKVSRGLKPETSVRVEEEIWHTYQSIIGESSNRISSQTGSTSSTITGTSVCRGTPQGAGPG